MAIKRLSGGQVVSTRLVTDGAIAAHSGNLEGLDGCMMNAPKMSTKDGFMKSAVIFLTEPGISKSMTAFSMYKLTSQL